MSSSTGPEPSAQGPSFDALRAEAIEGAQQLSSDSWTDYNTHDPGVTILEQYCYALTDLLHRIDFDVVDHLTGPDVRVAYEQLALVPPERIFPCRPTTPDDLRRALLDAVSELDNVWVDSPVDAHVTGLYVIRIRPRANVPASEHPRLVEAVRSAYAAMRNLCEGLDGIEVIPEQVCKLHARVVIADTDDPARVLAKVYYECARLLSGSVRQRPLEELRREGKTLERVFRGPLARHGYSNESDLSRSTGSFSVSEFYSCVKAIEGVGAVRNLHFDREAAQVAKEAGALALRLHIPTRKDEILVALEHEGREVAVELSDLLARIDEVSLADVGAGRVRQDASKLYTLPSGEHRALDRYTSIQTQLPRAYGVSQLGIPSTADREVKARSKQLRAYLALFDQLLANCAAQIESLRELFSPRLDSGRSYAARSLEGSGIWALEDIYPSHAHETDGGDSLPDPAMEALHAILARYDDFNERKGRVLDHLLGLYGETFSGAALRCSGASSAGRGSEAEERRVLQAKADYLLSIEKVGRDRGAGAYLDDEGWLQPSGLALRLGHQLGIESQTRHRLEEELAAVGLQALSPREAGDLAADERALPRAPRAEVVEAVALDLEGEASLEGSLAELIRQYGARLPLRAGTVTEEMLRRGAQAERYRLGQVEGESRWRLFFELLEGDYWVSLGEFESREEASVAAHGLLRLSREFSDGKEMLHVVEHVLLRPRAPGRELDAAECERYALRVSVVMPGWGERFRDPGFRQIAAEAVKENCPAHIAHSVLWLDRPAMQQFEVVYEGWLALSRKGRVDLEELDAAAEELERFLADPVCPAEEDVEEASSRGAHSDLGPSGRLS